jgi:putative transposon-encoded protein
MIQLVNTNARIDVPKEGIGCRSIYE